MSEYLSTDPNAGQDSGNEYLSMDPAAGDAEPVKKKRSALDVIKDVGVTGLNALGAIGSALKPSAVPRDKQELQNWRAVRDLNLDHTSGIGKAIMDSARPAAASAGITAIQSDTQSGMAELDGGIGMDAEVRAAVADDMRQAVPVTVRPGQEAEWLARNKPKENERIQAKRADVYARGITAGAARVDEQIAKQDQERAQRIQDGAKNPDSAWAFSVDSSQKLFGKGAQAVGGALGLDNIKSAGEKYASDQEKDIEYGGYQVDPATMRERFNEVGFVGALDLLGTRIAENWASTGATLVGGTAAALTAPFSVPAAVVIGGVTAVGSVGLGIGEVKSELEEKGIEGNDGLAVGAGLLVGLLDKFGAGKVIPKDLLTKMTGSEIVTALIKDGKIAAAKAVAKEIGKKSAWEVGTENVQEGIAVGAAASQGGKYTAQELIDRAIDTTAISLGMGGGAATASTAAEVARSPLSRDALIGRTLQSDVAARNFTPNQQPMSAGPTESDYRAATKAAFGGTPRAATPTEPDPATTTVVPSAVPDAVSRVIDPQIQALDAAELLDTEGGTDVGQGQVAEMGAAVNTNGDNEPPGGAGAASVGLPEGGGELAGTPGADSGTPVAARTGVQPDTALTPLSISDEIPQIDSTTPVTWQGLLKEKGVSPFAIRKDTPQWAALKGEMAARNAPPDTTVLQPASAPSVPLAPAVDTSLQNRDRSRTASVAQMSAIARNPDYGRLGISRTPDSGAPMVFSTGNQIDTIPAENFGRQDVAVMSNGQRVPFNYAVVDADSVQPSNFADGRSNPEFNSDQPGMLKALNNGRAAGMRAAYGQGTTGQYIEELRADATNHGVSIDAIGRTRNPVLVRLYDADANTGNMAARSQAQGLGMSPGELARQDAPMVDSGLLSVYQPGDVASADNRGFVRGFAGKLIQSGQDVAGMLTDQGALSPGGRQRIEAALVQAAYGDADLVVEMFDSMDTDIRAIGEALKSVAGQWAGMRDAANAGSIDPTVDITGNMLQAVRLVQRARRERLSLSDVVAQRDMFSGEAADPLTLGAIKLLYTGQYLTRAVGRDRLVESLNAYLAAAMQTRQDAGLFGDSVSADDILQAITGARDGTQTQDRTGQPQGGGNTGDGAGRSRAPEQRPVATGSGQADTQDGGSGQQAETGQVRPEGTERQSARGDQAGNESTGAVVTAFVRLVDNQFGPSGSDQDAIAHAETAVRDSITLETIVRPNGDKWNTAYVSNGDGTFAQVSVGSRELDRDAVMAEVAKERAKASDISQRTEEARQKRIDGASALGISVGTQWKDASAYVDGKGRVIYDTAKIVAYDEATGSITIEAYKRGMRAPVQFTTDYNSRLLENYPPPLELTGQTQAEIAAAESAEKKAAEKSARDDAKPTGPDVTADQVDLFNTQGGLFDGNRDEAKEKTAPTWNGEPTYGDKTDSQMRDGDIGSDKNKPYLSRGAAVGRIFKDASIDTHEVVQVGKNAFVVRPTQQEDATLPKDKTKESQPSVVETKIGGYPVSGLGDKALTAYLQSSNESDRVAAQAEIDKRAAQQKETNTEDSGAITAHTDLFNRVKNGAANAVEFKSAFDALLQNKDAVTSELSGMTKDAIFQLFPAIVYRYKNDKKADVVGAAFSDMVDDFTLGKGYSYGMGKDSQANAIRAVVESTTDQTLADHAKSLNDAREERAARRKDAEAGMEDPQTLDDFNRLMASKARDIGEGATDEKLAEGTFLDSSLPVNTGVNARLVVIDKTKETVEGLPLFTRGKSSMGEQALLADQSTADTLNKALVNYGLGASWSNAYEAVKLPDALSGIREEIQAAFGRDIRPVAPTNSAFDQFNGIHVGGEIYVNIASDVGFVQIAGHELYHDIERTRPDLIKWYQGQARQYLKDLPEYKDRLNNLLQPNESAYTDATAESELLADFMGDSLADQSFLQQLADSNPTKFKQFLNTVRMWLTQVANKLRGLDSSKHIADVKALQKHLGEVLNAFAEGKSIGGMAPVKRTNDLSTAWKMLAGDDAIFQNPTPDSFDMEGAAKEIDPGMSAVSDKPDLDEQKAGITNKWYVKMPDGNHAYVMENKQGEVWLDASRLKTASSGGTKLYLLVGSYAEGNGKVFIGDPAGLSDAALLRRTENMLSLALRFGKTEFMRPHEYQSNPHAKYGTGLADVVRPINWVEGDDTNNLEELIKTSYSNTVASVPEIKDVTYNFDKHRFERNGAEFTDQDFAALEPQRNSPRSNAVAVAGGAGRSATLKRAAIINTLARAAHSGRGGELLAEISRVLPGGLKGTPLAGVLYSRAPQNISLTDNPEQEKWLTREAKARGYKNIDEMAEKSYPAFEKLAAKWRERHPADVMLSSGKAASQTDSAAFNKWFGGSKVVDDDGNPLVVYHGTKGDFDSFDMDAAGPGALGQGFYFAETESTAGDFGPNVMRVYLSSKNPLVLSKLSESSRAEWNTLFEDDPVAAREVAIERGYDGILDDVYTDREWVVFNPEQIKSAIDNRGDFDPENADIRFSRQQPIPGTMPGFGATTVSTRTTAVAATNPNALPEETGLESARRIGQDAMLRFKVVQKWVEDNGTSLSEAANVYQLENLGKATTANKLEDFREFQIKPLYEKIAAAEFTIDDVTDYLEAVHIPEANARMRKIHANPQATANGITDQQAASVVGAFKAHPDFAKLQAVAAEVRALSNTTLQMRLDAGLITQEQFDAYKATYQNYVPLRGDMAGKPQGTGKGLSTNAKHKRRFGHEARDEFIFENLVADRERAIFQIEHNKLGRAVANFIIEAGNPDIGTVDKPVRQSVMKDFTYAVSHSGQAVASFETKQEAQAFVLKTVGSKSGSIKGLTLTAADFDIKKSYDPHVALMTRPMLADNEIQFYVKGSAIRIQLNDPLIARAATNSGIENLAGMLYVARQSLNFLSKAYTAWSPDFLMVNPVRDIYSGSVVLTGKKGIGFTGSAFKNYPWALSQLWQSHNDSRQSAWVTRYRAAGGNTGGAYLSDIERVGKDSAAAMNEFSGMVNTYNTVLAKYKAAGKSDTNARFYALNRSGLVGAKKLPVFGHFLRLMERLNGMFENSLRLAVFRTAIDAGKSDQQAAVLAKDLMNFNRKGEIANQMGAAYLFYNPGAQGAHIVAEALLTSPHKAQARALVGGMVMTAFLLAEMARGGDDDDEQKYKNIPDHVKSRNLVLNIGEYQATIPVAYGFGIFHFLGGALSDALHGEDATKLAIRTASALFENFSIFGNPLVEQDGKVEFRPDQLIPTIPKMVIAPGTNLDGLGRNIAPKKYQASKPDSENMTRALRGSSYAAVAATLNEWTGGNPYQPGYVDVSPNVLKYWVTSLTGGAGRFVGDVGDGSVGMMNGVAPDLQNIPVVRKFVRSPGVSDSRSGFWEIANQAKIAKEQYGLAKKSRDWTTADVIKSKNGNLVTIARRADNVADDAADLRNDADKIRRGDLSAKDKKSQINVLELKEKALYDKFLKNNSKTK